MGNILVNNFALLTVASNVNRITLKDKSSYDLRLTARVLISRDQPPPIKCYPTNIHINIMSSYILCMYFGPQK